MFEEHLPFGLTQKDGHQRGCVYYHRRVLARKTIFVVAEDFRLWPRVVYWKRIHPPEQIFNLAGQNVASSLPFQPLPSLLERCLNSLRERSSGFAGDLACQPFGGFILNAQRHI